MTSQALTRPLPTGGEVVRRLVGLQAQDSWITPYTIRPRAVDPDPGDVVVNWLMRGTLHMVAASDAAWLTALLGPAFIRKLRSRRLQLGLTDELLAKTVPQLAERLPATRAELLHGLGLQGQARAHLIAYAGMSGVLCLRGDTYVPLPDGPMYDVNELIRRYLEGYGPAGREDFVAWSGLRSRDFPASPAVKAQRVPRVRLLGHFDPYLLGYRDRSFTLDPVHAKQVQRGGGFLRPVVLLDGRVVGTWSRAGKDVAIEAWEPVPEDELAAEQAHLRDNPPR